MTERANLTNFKINKYQKYLFKIFDDDLEFIKFIAYLVFYDKKVFIDILNRTYESIIISGKLKVNTKKTFVTLLKEHLINENISLINTNFKDINEFNLDERIILAYKLYINKTINYHEVSKIINVSKKDIYNTLNKVNGIENIINVPDLEIRTSDLNINFNLIKNTNYLKVIVISVILIVVLIILFFTSVLIYTQMLMRFPSDSRDPNKFYDGDYYEVNIRTIDRNISDIFEEEVTMLINNDGLGFIVSEKHNTAIYFEGVDYSRFELQDYTEVAENDFKYDCDFYGKALINGSEYLFYNDSKSGYRNDLSFIFVDENINKTILVMDFVYIKNIN